MGQTWHHMTLKERAINLTKERNDVIRYELERKALYDE